MSNCNVLVAVTGSIAAYKACELVSSLKKQGHSVRVLLTPSALNFVGAASFEGLTGERVITDTFEEGQMMAHIELARWADKIIIYPATGNTINQLANGIATNILGTVYLALDDLKEVYIAPAMNTKMLNHPATKRSIEVLKFDGVNVLPTEQGVLACGEVGEGKALSPQLVEKIVFPSPLTNKKKVLITGGGTTETIDGARSITNFSSGRTSLNIAAALKDQGFDVTLLLSESAISFEGLEDINIHYFTDNSSLDLLLKKELSTNYDVIVHAAAVSDYTVENLVVNGEFISPSTNLKLDSSPETLTVNLRKAKKIIRSIKSYSKNKNVLLFGFKLTVGASKQSALEKIQQVFLAGCDFVVHNDLSSITKENHSFTVYNRDLKTVAEGNSKLMISNAIFNLATSPTLSKELTL